MQSTARIIARRSVLVLCMIVQGIARTMRKCVTLALDLHLTCHFNTSRCAHAMHVWRQLERIRHTHTHIHRIFTHITCFDFNRVYCWRVYDRHWYNKRSHTLVRWWSAACVPMFGHCLGHFAHFWGQFSAVIGQFWVMFGQFVGQFGLFWGIF